MISNSYTHFKINIPKFIPNLLIPIEYLQIFQEIISKAKEEDWDHKTNLYYLKQENLGEKTLQISLHSESFLDELKANSMVLGKGDKNDSSI